MKLRTAISGIIVSLCLSLALASPALSTDGPGFTVKRLVVSQNVVDKEPVGVGETFSADTREVYCFLEAGKIKNDTTVTFAWYFENREMARVSLKLGKGRRWR
ncbi:MAG: DUF2914 domain-containing protein, partial [Desulfobulbales bacterium]|nr:DUF2914 domain-containing protein [Desulfobulbales bacterium]